MAKSLFDYLGDLTHRKISWEDQDDKNGFQPYMIQRWLSMHPGLMEIISEVQPITDKLSPELFYRFYLGILPKTRFNLKYIKPTKSERNNTLLALISEFYQIGLSESEQILNNADKSDIIQFVRSFGYTDKEVKELLK